MMPSAYPPGFVAPPTGATMRPWLITIVDLMTILLTFFILMFSLATIDLARFKPIADSYGKAFGVSAEKAPDPLPRIAAVAGDNLGYLEAVLRTAFARHETLRDVAFRVTPQYLILTLPEGQPFAAKESGIAALARGRVFDLGGVLSNLHNKIAIVATVAHTNGGATADSWRLAIERADAMAGAFVAAGYDKDITVLGREAPAAPAAGTVGIEILIMPEGPSP